MPNPRKKKSTETDPDEFGYPVRHPLEQAFHRPAQLSGPLTREEHERHVAAYAAYLDRYFRAYDTAVRELSNPDRPDDTAAPDEPER
jgi:hypothetical protein